MSSTTLLGFKVTCPYCEQVFYELEEDPFDNCPYCDRDLEVLGKDEHCAEYVEDVEFEVELDYSTGLLK